MPVPTARTDHEPLPPDHALPFLLISAFRGLVDELHERLAAAGYPGLRAGHGFAMQAIGEGCTNVELGKRLGVSKQAATKTAQTLEHMGLVRRRANPADRREKVVAPTAAGRRMLATSGEIFTTLAGHWRDSVGDAAFETTVATLAQADPGRRTHTDLSDWV